MTNPQPSRLLAPAEVEKIRVALLSAESRGFADSSLAAEFARAEWTKRYAHALLSHARAQAEELERYRAALTEIAAPFEDFPAPEHKHLGDRAWLSMAAEQSDMARKALNPETKP